MTAPDQHPSWCTCRGHDGRGWHSSARLLVPADADTTGQPAAAVRLVQLVADAEPYVSVTGPRVHTADGDEGPAMLLNVRQSRALRRFLLVLTQQAER